MADKGMIQSAPLAPPNSPTITAADRSRIYGLIGRELDDTLNGASSFHPDGMKKSSSDLISGLDELVGTVTSMKDAVNDPTNVFGDALRQLRDFRKAFGDAASNDIETMWGDPLDNRDSKIKLPDGLAPTTRDNNVIYVDENPGPYSPPNPLLPKNWPKELRTSIESPGDVNAVPAVTRPDMPARLLSRLSSAHNNFPNQLPPSPQPVGPLGIYSGKPMPRWIVPPPIFNTR